MNDRWPTRIRGRFARSVRVDADDSNALEGYVPTARSLDVVRRVVRGMSDPHASRAFSITGPYGSGKSSLALFLDGLATSQNSISFRTAFGILRENDPDTAGVLMAARSSFGAPKSGFARGVVTAPEREPIVRTILRALHRAAMSSRTSNSMRERIEEAQRRASDERLTPPSYGEISDIIADMTASRPLLLLIDEFGKNLEAYGAIGSEGDLYLLQELAEWSSRGAPMILVTIQHQAFEAYDASSNPGLRREWAKVQGRFEDIPYVDSATASRQLISVAFDHGTDEKFNQQRLKWVASARREAESLGLAELSDPDLLGSCWPLHPSTLIVLPELCSRYGQNERTLFSFLASPEPLSVASWLRTKAHEDPWVRLDRVYDYFVESAGSFLTVGADAGRWTEIATTIRDTHGLTDAQLRVVKSVGVVNLVASAGHLRASADFIGYACADGKEGTADTADVSRRLAELKNVGLLTFRDYAHEYRIWRGSDFDIEGRLDVHRRAARDSSMAALLRKVRPMPPLVAARHSTVTGTVRAFAQDYADATTGLPELPELRSVCDGLLVYLLDDAPLKIVGEVTTPVVTITPMDATTISSAAVEYAALTDLLDDVDLPTDDRTARREIAERSAHARGALDRAISETFGLQATWQWHNPPEGAETADVSHGVATARLSRVFDAAFEHGPPRVAYEAINRAELTSAGAKARRIVQEALVDPSKHEIERLGLTGSGADVAMYEAVLRDPGIHDVPGGLSAPHPATGWAAVWDRVIDELKAEKSPVSADHLLRVMMACPYGLREGTASLLLTALLIANASRLAAYEHGTFEAHLSAPFVERLAKNPANFGFKYIGTSERGIRRAVVDGLHRHLDKLSMGTRPKELSLLSTIQRIAGHLAPRLTSYVRKTTRFHGLQGLDEAGRKTLLQVRDALVEAREPDVLLYDLLPEAMGMPPIRRGRGAMSKEQVPHFVQGLATSLARLSSAQEALHANLFEMISDLLVARAPGGHQLTPEQARRAIVSDAERIAHVETLAGPVREFTSACLMHGSNPEELAAQIATTVTGASPVDWDDASHPRHVDELAEAAKAFRRVVDLHRARSAYEEGDASFRAYVVNITDPTGRVDERVVALSEADRAHLDDLVARALDELVKSPRDPVEMLLGALSARLLPTQEEDRATSQHSMEDSG